MTIFEGMLHISFSGPIKTLPKLKTATQFQVFGRGKISLLEPVIWTWSRRERDRERERNVCWVRKMEWKSLIYHISNFGAKMNYWGKFFNLCAHLYRKKGVYGTVIVRMGWLKFIFTWDINGIMTLQGMPMDKFRSKSLFIWSFASIRVTLYCLNSIFSPFFGT